MFFKVLLRFCGANSGFGVSKFCGFSKFCSTFVDQFEIRFFKGFAPLLRGKFKIRFFKVFRFFKSFAPLLWSEKVRILPRCTQAIYQSQPPQAQPNLCWGRQSHFQETRSFLMIHCILILSSVKLTNV